MNAADIITHKTGEYTRQDYPRARGTVADAMDWETKARLEALKAQLGRKSKEEK